MLDLETRTAILRLHHEGHGARKIAQALRVSRNAVRRVIRDGAVSVPPLVRDERLAPHIDQIRQLHLACKGNLVRVAEELHADGVDVGYSTLTGFCRRYEIGTRPKTRAGRYLRMSTANRRRTPDTRPGIA